MEKPQETEQERHEWEAALALAEQAPPLTQEQADVIVRAVAAERAKKPR